LIISLIFHFHADWYAWFHCWLPIFTLHYAAYIFLFHFHCLSLQFIIISLRRHIFAYSIYFHWYFAFIFS
jgi:hypothetical protein